MPDVTFRVVFRRLAAGLHVAVSSGANAGLLLGGETVEGRVFDPQGNYRGKVTYGIVGETGVHLSVNFAGAAAEFQHDENDELPFDLGDRLTFRSITILLVDILSVSFTHRGRQASGRDLGVGLLGGVTELELTALFGTTNNNVVLFQPGRSRSP